MKASLYFNGILLVSCLGLAACSSNYDTASVHTTPYDDEHTAGSGIAYYGSGQDAVIAQQESQAMSEIAPAAGGDKVFRQSMRK